MRYGYPAGVAVILLVLAPASADKNEKDPAKALRSLGADVKEAAPFRSVYRSLLDEKFDFRKEKQVQRVWIEATWKGGKKGLQHLTRLPTLHGVSFQSGSEAPDWYDVLKGLPDLQEFCAIGPTVTDDCCEWLSGCKKMATISVPSSTITDKGLMKLKNLKELEWVSFKDAEQITNKGFASVSVEKLRYLNLDGTRVNNIVSLKKATQLEFLTLSGRDEKRNGLRDLVGLKTLKRLQIGALKPRETDMKEILNKSPNLSEIETNRGNFTRKGWQREDDLKEKLKKLPEKQKN